MHAGGARAVLGRIAASAPLRRVLVASFAFFIAEHATWVAILLYAYDQAGPASVGLVALIQLLPGAFFAAPAAALADRYPRERVLTAGYLLSAVTMAATAASMLAALPFPVVVAIGSVAATTLVIDRPARSALLPSLAETPEELTAANSAAGVAEGGGNLLGPLLAAAILAGAGAVAGGPAIVFLVGAMAMVVAAVSVVAVRPVYVAHVHDDFLVLDGPATVDAGARDITAASPDVGFLAGVRTVARDPDARLVVLLLTVRMAIIGAADVVFVLLALDVLRSGDAGAALLSAASGGGLIVGGAIAFWLAGRAGLALTAAAGAMAWGIGVLSAGVTASPPVAPLLILAGGAGLAIVDVAGRTILQRSIRDAVLARVFGVQESLAMAALSFGSLAASALATGLGFAGMLVVVAATLPVVVGLIWGRLAALDRRFAAPVRQLALLRRTEVFGLLSAPTLEAVARRAQWVELPAGATIIREGDPGDRYYVLEAGSVRVEQGGRHVRDLTHAGEGFGEIALLRDVPRTASVIATSDVHLLAVDRVSFLAAVTSDPTATQAAERIAATRR